MIDGEQFSLERLERLAYTREHEKAAQELVKLLRFMDAGAGSLGPLGDAPSGDPTGDERDAHFAARIAAALAALFADPAFTLTDEGFLRLLGLQRWISSIFGASAFANADHVIRVFNRAPVEAGEQLRLDDGDVLKLCLLYSLDSNIELDIDALWRKSRRLAGAFVLALLSTRLVLTEPAQRKREWLLGWLATRLEELTLDELPIEIIHHVWMHCSYALRPDKHAIKRSINALVRAKLLANGFRDISEAPPPREKPVLLCIVEWFGAGHSIYRTHSLSLEALKTRYHVVGISLRDASEELTRHVFDEVHVLPRVEILESVRAAHALAERLRPDVVYYPSIGMFPDAIFLCNLRLAPVQMAALGHPATTHSPFIDYVLVEEDYLGDPRCFSERVVALPAAAIPYRPPAGCPALAAEIRVAPDLVRIAVAASLMKINASFLEALGRIAAQSKTRVEFHIFSLAAHGLAKTHLQNAVRRFLHGNFVVYPALPYERYLHGINSCDMFLNPFPFGNTNGIVDTIRQGLPGVCLTGPEVHSHIDEGLFRRFGLPEWMVARSIDDYVRAAVRLAENSSEREELSRRIQQTDPDTILFEGNPELFAQAVAWLQATHRGHAALGGGSVIRPRLAHPPFAEQGGKSKARERHSRPEG